MLLLDHSLRLGDCKISLISNKGKPKMNVANGIIGVLLLTFGRKLFWLFIGCLGFIAGLQMAEQYFGTQPLWMAWAVGLVFGLIGALLAIFFQNVAIILGGFIAGSTIAAYLTTFFGFADTPLISIIGGILGTIILYSLFDYALIALSSLVGATLIIEEVILSSEIEMILYAVLIGVGMIFQIILWRLRKPSK